MRDELSQSLKLTTTKVAGLRSSRRPQRRRESLREKAGIERMRDELSR